jgi:hypothetical protein
MEAAEHIVLARSTRAADDACRRRRLVGMPQRTETDQLAAKKSTAHERDTLR